MRWPKNKEEHAYMKMMQAKNKKSSRRSKAESWMKDKLASTGKKWSRQAQWGYRLFDFWNHELGIAVEVDGPEHDKEYDAFRDRHNLKRSGILVLRVRNFNEKDAEVAITTINEASSWKERREKNKNK